MPPPLTQGARSAGSRPAHTAHSRLLNCAPAPAWSQTGAWCCGQKQAGTLGSVATPTTHSTCLQYRRRFFLDNLHSGMIPRSEAAWAGATCRAPSCWCCCTGRGGRAPGGRTACARAWSSPRRGRGRGPAARRGGRAAAAGTGTWRQTGTRAALSGRPQAGTGGALINYWCHVH